MAAQAILHIGDDLCRRIPVMETAGFAVFQSRADIPAIRIAFDREEDYSAVVFHNDVVAVPEDAFEVTRSLSEAPLILFENPTVATDDKGFDLVIPALTPPDVWLLKLREVVQASQLIRRRSVQFRENSATIRSESRNLHLRSLRNRTSAIDPDAIWRAGETNIHSDSKPPEEAHPDNARKKAG